MSRSSGTYTAPSSSWNPAVEGTTVDETDWNALLDDIETALTESVYTGGLGSTDNRLVRTDGTDTKKVQGTGITVDDSNNVSGVVNQSMTGYLDVSEIATPGNPAANTARLYAYDDSGTTKVAFRDSAGTETVIGSGGGGGGDLVAANNLSDVSSAATSFRNLAEGISNTQGTILYRDGSQWTALPVGTSGQVLQTQGAGANPQWATVSGTGDMAAATYDPATIAEQLVGLTATQTLTNKTLTTPTITLKQSASPTPTAEGDIQWDTDGNFIVVGDGASHQVFYAAIDEDTMSSDSATRVPTQQSVKAYVDANGGGGLTGFRNRLINGGMIFNRRAVASNADDTYGFDRWNILTQTDTVAVSQLTDVEDTTPFMQRITQSQATAQRFGVEQIIESGNCKDMRGQAVVLSARVRCSASTTLRYAIIEWTGTADTVTSDFVNDWTSATYTAGNFFTTTSTTITATGSTALTANTLATVSLTGTLGSSLNNVAVLFWTDSAQAQNVTLDIGKVQFELGSSATTFEVRPFPVEDVFCKRYLPIIENVSGSQELICLGYATNADIAVMPFTFTTPPRVAPTGIVASTTSTTFLWASPSGGGSSGNPTAITFASASLNASQLNWTHTGMFTLAYPVTLNSLSGGKIYWTGSEL